MSFLFIAILLHLNLISAVWVKLPNILPTSAVPKVIFKLAPPSKNSVLSSEIISSVFSTNPSTTENFVHFETSTTKKSTIRKYFDKTVTSKVVHFSDTLPNNTTNDDFLEPVVLQSPNSNKDKNRVIYFNKTVQVNVVPIKSHQLVNKHEEIYGENYSTAGLPDDQPDELYYDDEYYYEDDVDETTKFVPSKTTSTTTEIPRKSHKKKTINQKLQRRTMIQMMKSQQYKPFGDITFPSFIRFLKKIQESFAIRTAKTIGEKIKMLAHFRDQLMLTINKQIRRLWRVQPQSGKSSNLRIKRTLGLDQHHSSGAMEFPSAEGALLSICFLTFAVFLIKLVLQVIQTIKMKKAMWATQMMMGTDNVVIKRQKRSSDATDDDFSKLVKIYDSIEKLKLKY